MKRCSIELCKPAFEKSIIFAQIRSLRTDDETQTMGGGGARTAQGTIQIISNIGRGRLVDRVLYTIDQ